MHEQRPDINSADVLLQGWARSFRGRPPSADDHSMASALGFRCMGMHLATPDGAAGRQEAWHFSSMSSALACHLAHVVMAPPHLCLLLGELALHIPFRFRGLLSRGASAIPAFRASQRGDRRSPRLAKLRATSAARMAMAPSRSASCPLSCGRWATGRSAPDAPSCVSRRSWVLCPRSALALDSLAHGSWRGPSSGAVCAERCGCVKSTCANEIC